MSISRCPSGFYGEVEVGSTIRATSEIFPGEVFTGELIGVGRRIDTVSRSFTARARVANPDLRLPADVFMRVTLVLEERDGIIAPEEAVSSEGGSAYLYIIADGKAERRKVSIGIRRAGIAEIADGVEAGEMVVTRGLQKVRDGAPVRILDLAPNRTPERDDTFRYLHSTPGSGDGHQFADRRRRTCGRFPTANQGVAGR